MVSGCEVNWLIDEVGGEGLPTIDLAHIDLAGGEQRPEQHRGSVRGRQHGLRLDPSFEFLVQPLDRIRSPRTTPLAGRYSAKVNRRSPPFSRLSATARC